MTGAGCMVAFISLLCPLVERMGDRLLKALAGDSRRGFRHVTGAAHDATASAGFKVSAMRARASVPL